MLLTNPISGVYHSALKNNQRDAALTTTILPVSGFARTAQNSFTPFPMRDYHNYSELIITQSTQTKTAWISPSR
jgi:hypothetical protein